MAFLDKLIHRPAHVTNETCQHLDLRPQFERPADAADESKASSYRCAGCGLEVEPGQAFLMRMKYKAGMGLRN